MIFDCRVNVELSEEHEYNIIHRDQQNEVHNIKDLLILPIGCVCYIIQAIAITVAIVGLAMASMHAPGPTLLCHCVLILIFGCNDTYII